MFDTHLEKDLIINNRELKYSGIFRSSDLFSTINRALEERGYEKREKKTEEEVTEESRRTLIELRPYKIKTNYLILVIKIRVLVENLTDTTKVINNQTFTFLQGDMTIVFDD